MGRLRAWALLASGALLLAAGCSGGGAGSQPPDAGLDAAPADAGGRDALADVDTGSDGGSADAGGPADASIADGGAADAPADAGGVAADPGFGAIDGPCGRTAEELDAASPSFFLTHLDFMMDPFDDPEDVPALTPGGRELLAEGTAGGSSIVSEVFAYEVLHRCEGATLLLSETEIDYDADGPITDMLVRMQDMKIGVSVTRAIAFPFEDPYTVEQATNLLSDKLADVLASSANVSAQDEWGKQILVIMAYADMHGDSLRAAWDTLDSSLRADTIVYVVVTDGADAPLY